MKHQSIIVSAFVLAAGLGVWLPATAGASGPLLSGYGGPGAGSQAILGSTLLGGGGSGGSSYDGGSGGGVSAGSPVSGSRTTGAGGRASTFRGSTGANGQAHGSSGPSGSRGSATHPGAAGANPQTPNFLRVGQASSSVSSWFSGANLLAVLLAVGVLVLVGFTTVRLARTQHH